MMLLYSFALSLGALFGAPWWGWRMLRQDRYRVGLRERLGAVPDRLAEFVQAKPVVWLHAVSVGELLAATRLVADLEAELPDHALVISTTTPTGQSVARERFGVDRVFFYPLDFAFAVRPFLRVLRPRLVILIESELWPRMLVECDRRGIPVAVVNARVSDRSLPRYMALRMLWQPLLQRITLLLAQSDEDARRWCRIGAPADRVRSVGNLKYDVRIPDETPLTSLVRAALPAGARVLVCGSTHDGEESLLLDCWRRIGAVHLMILAPRHPERTAHVEELAINRGIAAIRLSTWRLSRSTLSPGMVVLIDSVGELSSLYALATVAFVGGSLVPHGGQNPLEAARFGVPVLMGPSFENFRSVVAGMQAVHAIEVVTPDALCSALETRLQTLASSEAEQRSRAFFESQAGATGRTVAALLRLLQEPAR